VKLPNILTNDRAVGTGNVLSGATIDLDPAPGIQTTFMGNSGTFTLDPLTGDVRFAPAPGFRGTVTIPYTVDDIYGQK
jgi:hypothetical protein